MRWLRNLFTKIVQNLKSNRFITLMQIKELNSKESKLFSSESSHLESFELRMI